MGHNVVGLMIPEFLPCATMRCLQNRLVIMTYRLTILRGKMDKISTSIGVWNWGTPKSSISMVFSIISHLFWVAPWLWKPPIGSNWCSKLWWFFFLPRVCPAFFHGPWKPSQQEMDHVCLETGHTHKIVTILVCWLGKLIINGMIYWHLFVNRVSLTDHFLSKTV